jgi:hypothetical protein
MHETQRGGDTPEREILAASLSEPRTPDLIDGLVTVKKKMLLSMD